MSTTDDAAAKYRKQAKELRTEATKTTDPVMREMLLNAAKVRDELAGRRLRKATEW
jgi:hypothetical protein